MAWFSTVYAADPDRALDVVLRSAGPGSLVRERDLTFRRARPRSPRPGVEAVLRMGPSGRAKILVAEDSIVVTSRSAM